MKQTDFWDNKVEKDFEKAEAIILAAGSGDREDVSRVENYICDRRADCREQLKLLSEEEKNAANEKYVAILTRIKNYDAILEKV